jgi:hypothetical protein
VADITYIRFGIRFLYLAAILDAYSRSQDLTLDALKMALRNGTPLIFHSDYSGSQAG